MQVNVSGLRFWPATDVGRVRDHNEDAFLVDDQLGLFVVCDGMGGHAAGEVASALSAQTVREVLTAEKERLHAFEQGNGTVSRTDILQLMESSVQTACARVYQEGQSDPSRRGMGTTLEAMLIIGNRGFIAHVGDSRVYLCRSGAVHQLTEDHSLINELIKRGRLKPDQIAKVKYKNAVTRAVGVYESVEVDVFDFDVLPGDRYLMCSDGLHEYLEEAELPRLFDKVEIEQLSNHFINLANERGGKDNITALVVQSEAGLAAQTSHADEVNLKLDVLHQMPLFRFLSYQELVRVLNITLVQSYADGEKVVTEGEEGDDVYIVLEGAVRVHSGETTYTTLAQGQHFGELALIDRATRSASVTAMGESRLLIVRRPEFFNLVRTHHDLAVKLLWSFLGVLAGRLRSTNQELGVARQMMAAEELSSNLLQTENPPPAAKASTPPPIDSIPSSATDTVPDAE